jgi:hypothetical protein
MKRIILKLAAVVLPLLSAALLLTPTEVKANVNYPSGCHTYAYGSKPSGWDANCWLGENGSAYINDAFYVQGLQIILQGEGYYTLGIDGLFGNGTYVGTRLYQSHHGLTSDGIVGNNTWHSLLSQLSLVGYFCSGTCWWQYSSPGTIGTSRWHMQDLRVGGNLYPWDLLWNGNEAIYGNEEPL